MSHVVIFTDEEFKVLKMIVEKINPTVINTTATHVKKKSKSELRLESIREYRSNKKRRN